jgi:hypothetical protein
VEVGDRRMLYPMPFPVVVDCDGDAFVFPFHAFRKKVPYPFETRVGDMRAFVENESAEVIRGRMSATVWILVVQDSLNSFGPEPVGCPQAGHSSADDHDFRVMHSDPPHFVKEFHTCQGALPF